LCRERAAKQPQDFSGAAKSWGPLCGPFATQGRSYKEQCVGLQETILYHLAEREWM